LKFDLNRQLKLLYLSYPAKQAFLWGFEMGASQKYFGKDAKNWIRKLNFLTHLSRKMSDTPVCLVLPCGTG